MITPVGHRLLIKPQSYTEKDESIASAEAAGIYIPEKELERDQNAVTRGKIVSIGHSAWRAFDPDWKDWKPWCSVGDTVLYSKFKGLKEIDPDDGEEYIVINDDDVQAVITEAK